MSQRYYLLNGYKWLQSSTSFYCSIVSRNWSQTYKGLLLCTKINFQQNSWINPIVGSCCNGEALWDTEALFLHVERMQQVTKRTILKLNAKIIIVFANQSRNFISIKYIKRKGFKLFKRKNKHGSQKSEKCFICGEKWHFPKNWLKKPAKASKMIELQLSSLVPTKKEANAESHSSE